MVKICKHCGKEFVPKNGHVKYCSDECRKFAAYLNKLHADSEWLKKNKIENEEYVIDRWNNIALINMNHSLYFKKMHPGKTIDEYKQEFPDALLSSKKYIRDVSKNSGKYVMDEKQRKALSERVKGENNPNHRSKTTEQQRKERSPFSKEFYKKHDGNRDVFIKNVADNRLYTTQVEYYIERKGMTEEDAQEALRERQSTFTLDKCIKKYGKEEGTRIYNERQEKWAKKMKESYELGLYSKSPINLSKSLTSELERNLIDKIIKTFNLDESCVYSYKSKQINLFDEKKHRRYFYDFAYKNKIIEINGDFWHMNPKQYNEYDINAYTQLFAYEIWKYDKNKIGFAKTSGYDVLVVWESDIKKNENHVLNKIKKFLQI